VCCCPCHQVICSYEVKLVKLDNTVQYRKGLSLSAPLHAAPVRALLCRLQAQPLSWCSYQAAN
jgi:hypothetical protein